MSFFKSNEKAYNLDNKINKKIKNIVKKDNILNYDREKELIEYITNFYMKNIDNYSTYYGNDLLKLVDEDNKVLLDMFNMNNLLLNLKELLDNYEYDKFINDDNYRRNIMYATLLNIIKIGGPYKGSEYGLIYSKAFNFDYSTSMMYASYDSSMLNERFIEFLNKYISLGGSTNVYWLPNYFKNDTKDKYIMEPLYEVVKYTNMFGKNEKILQK